MRLFKKMQDGMLAIANSLTRYPMTIIWLLGMSIMNAIQIQEDIDSYSRLLFTFSIGALLAMVGQQVYERFFHKKSERWIMVAITTLLTALYYFTLPQEDTYQMIYPVRTIVLLFALFISFIWIPTIKNKVIYFHQNIMAVFKAAMLTLLFAGVLAIGVYAVLGSVDFLLFNLDYRVYLHAMNVIWTLFATSYFLSQIPDYRNGMTDKLKEAFEVPRFLEVLLTFIVIPIVAVYTVVLFLYVILNIRSEFWTDNLLEPLLISYAIIVILVYLLVSNIEHKYSQIFQRLFPKIMLIVVLFQTIASILKIQDYGITAGRYYVILFGIFAIAAGALFSFFTRDKNGLIAPILILLSVVSVIPPIDAFTVAQNSQMRLLETTLTDNEMLIEGVIKPNPDIPIKDKVKITKSVEYLGSWHDFEEVSYLPDDFEIYSDFQDLFGFPRVYSLSPDDPDSSESNFVYYDWGEETTIPLEGADYLVRLGLYNAEETDVQTNVGENYQLLVSREGKYFLLTVKDRAGSVVMVFDTEDLIVKAFENYTENIEGGNIDLETITQVKENERIRIKVIASQLDEYQEEISGELFVFVTFK